MTIEAVAGEDMVSATWFTPGDLRKLNTWFSAKSLTASAGADETWLQVMSETLEN